MVSKNQIKLITSLVQKKYRDKHKLFVAEGIKVIEELYTEGLILQNLYTISLFDKIEKENQQLVTELELKKISNLKTPQTALAVFSIPEAKNIDITRWIVVLDDIRDPGNLGTIIRLCDWYGISTLVCSPETVDCYNPKVVQSTMGSIARVGVHYQELDLFFEETQLPVYGTFMDGENVYKNQLPKQGILVLGNEANGISSEVEKMADKKISIPRFGKKKTESLNVAMAAAIFLSEIHRAIEM